MSQARNQEKPSDDIQPAKIYETVAAEFKLPANHEAVVEVVALRRSEEVALDALRDVLDHYDQTAADLYNFRFDKLTTLRVRDAFMEDANGKLADVFYRDVSGAKGPNAAFYTGIDLRKLHDINKKGGHPAGDRVLGSTGLFLDNLVIPDDEGLETLAGRLGGDEFGVLVCYDKSVLDEETAKQKIIIRLNKWAVEGTPHGIRIGDPATITPEKTWKDIFKEADPKAPKSKRQAIGRLAVNLFYSTKRSLNLKTAA